MRLPAVLLLAAIVVVPIWILIDSGKRLGRFSWGWALFIGVGLLALPGQAMNVLKAGGSAVDIWAYVVAAYSCFWIYRMGSGASPKTKPQLKDSNTLEMPQKPTQGKFPNPENEPIPGVPHRRANPIPLPNVPREEIAHQNKMSLCQICQTRVWPMKTGQCPACRGVPQKWGNITGISIDQGESLSRKSKDHPNRFMKPGEYQSKAPMKKLMLFSQEEPSGHEWKAPHFIKVLFSFRGRISRLELVWYGFLSHILGTGYEFTTRVLTKLYPSAGFLQSEATFFGLAVSVPFVPLITYYIWTFLALYVKRAQDLNDLPAYLIFPLLSILLGFAEFMTKGENLPKWIYGGVIIVWCVVGLFYIYMLVKLFVWQGTNGSNQYGPDPLEEKRGILGQFGRMSRRDFSFWIILFMGYWGVVGGYLSKFGSFTQGNSFGETEKIIFDMIPAIIINGFFIPVLIAKRMKDWNIPKSIIFLVGISWVAVPVLIQSEMVHSFISSKGWSPIPQWMTLAIWACILLPLMLIKGTDGKNRYGEDPLEVGITPKGVALL